MVFRQNFLSTTFLSLAFRDGFFGCKLNKKTGFTLMELVIVIVVLGILAGLITPNLITSIKRGRDGRRRADLKAMELALQTFYSRHQSYPEDDGNGHINGFSWGEEFNEGPIIYMNPLPEDPKNGQSYYYQSTDGSGYELEACLEVTAGENVDCSLILDCPSTKCDEIKVE